MARKLVTATNEPVTIKDQTFAVAEALDMWNQDYQRGWDFGTNFTNEDKPLIETFINKYLFPKITETTVVDIELGNRFNWLYEEVENIGQFSEEYVIMDTVPVSLNLSLNEELMLKRNYPRMATKLYGGGSVKKVKFTLNNNDTRQNYLRLEDIITNAIAVYKKKIYDINVTEEFEVKAMMIDYALNVYPNEKIRIAGSLQELATMVGEALLNLQNNSAKYNECNTASGGAIGRYTTTTNIEDVLILTTDYTKTYLLDTKLANTFQVGGIDYTGRVMSFDDLGGVYKILEDIVINDPATITQMRAFGDYQVEIGHTIQEGVIFTWDITTINEFANKYEEIVPTDELFVYITDIKKLRLKRSTKGMLKEPFNNGEFDETNHWLHYWQSKKMSPFFNNIVIGGEGLLTPENLALYKEGKLKRV